LVIGTRTSSMSNRWLTNRSIFGETHALSFRFPGRRA
jgi:hypothetical protein